MIEINTSGVYCSLLARDASFHRPRRAISIAFRERGRRAILVVRFVILIFLDFLHLSFSLDEKLTSKLSFFSPHYFTVQVRLQGCQG